MTNPIGVALLFSEPWTPRYGGATPLGVGRHLPLNAQRSRKRRGNVGLEGVTASRYRDTQVFTQSLKPGVNNRSIHCSPGSSSAKEAGVEFEST
jgi:hypothetical protein